MSILLDALKKSERRQRLGEAPSLAAGHGEPGGSDDQRPGNTWRYALVVVPVLACIGWLAWQQYSPMGEQPRPGSDAEVSAPASVANDVGAVDAQSPVATADDGTEIAAAEPRVVTRRSPVEDLPDSPALDRAPGDDESESPGADPATADDEVARLREPSPATAAAEEPHTESDPAEDADHGDGADGQSRAQVLTYWELPGSVRNGLPPLAVTVMVYSDVPANRFALVDGRRLGEGDDAGSGVMLVRIRRDGVVFRKGAYRFLVKP